jgi:prepilin-type N-terminal cleavage/methylation domain-containing protein
MTNCPANDDCAKRFTGESGLTMVELLVVIVIIAIVAGIALLQRGSADIQLRRQNAAQALKEAFERARFDSVKRRAECDAEKSKVVVLQNSFELWTDKNNNRVLESSERETTSFAGQNIVIDGISLIAPVTVKFNQRGEVDARDSLTITNNPGFLVCNVTCGGTISNLNANKVFVTPTGTVNMIGGGESPPSFGGPGGSSVGTTAEINDNMVLSPGGGGCPP